MNKRLNFASLLLAITCYSQSFAGNHEDSACMHGDAHGRDARPCSWFGARVEESLTGRGAKCCSVVPIGR